MKKHNLFSSTIGKLIYIIPILVLLYLVLCASSYAQSLPSGSISINSNPQGARVYLGNDYKGETPLTIRNINTGQYSIKMVLPGYQEWNSSILVLPILTITINADLTPEPKLTYGSISVNSKPQGANIYLDDFYEGSTPLNIRNIATGQYRIELVLSGYQKWESNISVLPSQVARVFVELLPLTNYGSIEVFCNQIDAKIYLNGAYQKTISAIPAFLENVRAGKNEIVVIKDGFRAWVEDIEVYSDQVSFVDVVLTEMFK